MKNENSHIMSFPVVPNTQWNAVKLFTMCFDLISMNSHNYLIKSTGVIDHNRPLIDVI